MVMKDKLKKNHRKGRRVNLKKLAVISSTTVVLICAIAIPTYIMSSDKDENQGIAQVETSIEETTISEEDKSTVEVEEELEDYSL